MKGVVPFTARRASATHEDCRFWGLTPNECRGHHMRLAAYHVRRAEWYLKHATRHLDRASVAIRWAYWALLAAVVLVYVWKTS